MAWRSRTPESRAQVPPQTLYSGLAKHRRRPQDSLPLPRAPNASPNPLSSSLPAAALQSPIRLLPDVPTALPTNATGKAPAYLLLLLLLPVPPPLQRDSRRHSPVTPDCGSPWRSHLADLGDRPGAKSTCAYLLPRLSAPSSSERAGGLPPSSGLRLHFLLLLPGLRCCGCYHRCVKTGTWRQGQLLYT